MSNKIEIRTFPAATPRIETGPIQFGDDWPGTFLRGDTAAGYALYLSQLIKWVEQQPAHIDPFVLGPVRSLLSCSPPTWRCATRGRRRANERRRPIAAA